MLAMSLAASGGSFGADAVLEQAEAIAEIESLGGRVEIDETDPDTPAISVTFSNADIDDAALVHLQKLPEITGLYLDCPGVTDAGLLNLKGLSRLKTLVLADLGLDDIYAEKRKTRPAAAQVTDAGLAYVAGLTELRELCVSGRGITDAGLRHLKGLTELETLFLAETSVTDAGLAYLAGLAKIYSLAVTKTNITDAGLEHLAPLRRLRELCLYDTKVGDEGLVHLSGLPKLEALILSGTQVTDRGLGTLGEMPQLTCLLLTSTGITDAGLKHLENLRKLEVLHLRGNDITDVGVEHLARLTKLEELLLDEIRITDNVVPHFERLTRLEYLSLSSTRITDTHLQSFTCLPKLGYLNLQDSKVTPEGLEDLQQAMPVCRIVWQPVQPPIDPPDAPGDRLPSGHELETAEIATLIETLANDQDALKRCEAALAIGRKQDLLRWAVDKRQDISEKTAKALATAIRSDKEETVRAAAIDALLFAHAPSQIPWNALAQALEDSSPTVRVKAAAALSGPYKSFCEDACLAVPPLLAEAAQSDDPVVRGLASLASGNESTDRKAALPVLLAALRREDASPMPRLSRDATNHVGPTILRFIGAIGADAVGAVPLVLGRTSRLKSLGTEDCRYDRESACVAATIDALVGIGRLAVPELAEQVVTKHGVTRTVAALALVELGEHRDKAIPPLIRSLRGTSGGRDLWGENRRFDVVALAKCGHEAVPALLTASKSRSAGCLALVTMTEMEDDADAVVSLLIAAMDNPDASIRLTACSVLGRFVLVEKEGQAISALLRATKDANEDVAAQAAGTIAIARKRRIESDDDLKLIADLTKLESLCLSDTSITGAGLVHLSGLKNLRELTLPPTFTDAGMSHIQEFTALERLKLVGTQITDDGMKHLRGLKRLYYLDLCNTQITDAGIVHLRGLTNLVVVDLGGTRITGAGLQHLARATKLERLGLWETAGITDAGIAHLRLHTRMGELDLRKTQVTNAGLIHLARMKNLTCLHLSDHITDAGLPWLEGLSKLRQVGFGKGKVTEDAMRRLEKAVPKLRVARF